MGDATKWTLFGLHVSVRGLRSFPHVLVWLLVQVVLKAIFIHRWGLESASQPGCSHRTDFTGVCLFGWVLKPCRTSHWIPWTDNIWLFGSVCRQNYWFGSLLGHLCNQGWNVGHTVSLVLQSGHIHRLDCRLHPALDGALNLLPSPGNVTELIWIIGWGPKSDRTAHKALWTIKTTGWAL